MGGPVKNIPHSAVLDRFTGVHDHHLVAEFGHQTQMVGDEQDRATDVFMQPAQPLYNLYLQGGVQGGGRFVGDQQGGLGDQGHGDGDSLAHAAGELMGIVHKAFVGIGNTHPGQHPGRPLHFGLFAQVVAILDVGHLAAHGQYRIEGRHGVLKYHRNPVAPDRTQFVLGHGQDIPPLEVDDAVLNDGVFGQKVKDGVDDRGLAAAAFTHQADNAPGRNVHGHMAQRPQPSAPGLEIDRQILYLQYMSVFDGGINGHEFYTSRLSLGSKTSRKASPKKVNPRVVRIRGTPPAITSQGVLRMNA